MSEPVPNGKLHGRTVSFDDGATRVRSEPTPAWTFTDDDGREVDLAVVDRVAGTALDDLVAMYAALDGRHRAQGLPPTGREAIREWLSDIRSGLHLVARHDDRTVGHVAVVPDGSGEHELVIFVHQSYHNAGIGTQLLRTLLSYASTVGVTAVWLTVEHSNRPAIALYEKMGFEPEENARPTLKMRFPLTE